jgi:hypothetical protein
VPSYAFVGIGLALVAALVAFVRTARRRRSLPDMPWGAPLPRHRDFAAIAAAASAWPAKNANAVSDRTWKDLALDAVFERLDRCVTSAGQQILYRNLRHPVTAPADIETFGARVGAFIAGEALREAANRALLPLTKRTTLALAPIIHGQEVRWPVPRWAIRSLTFVTVGAAVVTVVWAPALVVAVIGVIAGIVLRVYLHEMMSVQATALASVVDLLVAAERLTKMKTDGLEVERSTLRTALARIAPYRRDMAWLTIDQTQLNEVAASLIFYFNVFLLLDVHAFMRSIELVRDHRPALATLLETVGEIDAARSIASYRAGTKTCVPMFAEKGSPIAIEDARHPLIEDAVPNDVLLTNGRGWLVSGSNMAGKSTLLRCIATSALLAQTIGCVPAASYSAPMLVVRTMMQIEDDILAGRSHFLAEATTARDLLLEGADADRLFVFDELFRGTNIADRVAAAGAFLRAMNRAGYVVAATHDAELIALLRETFVPHYFTEHIDDGKLVFDYRLHRGALAPRNALAVLALVGFPARVLEDARELAGSSGSELHDEDGVV